MRKLASIVEIDTCKPIEGTDRLSVATMKGKGWQVVVGRDEFVPGDLCVYFEIDSFLDPNDARYAFLRDRCLRKITSKSGAVLREGLRIKTISLRKVVSQGLLMPLSVFPEIMWLGGEPIVGKDVTALLHVEHYDEVWSQINMSCGDSGASESMQPFPAIIPKTDEERIQNLGDWFESKKGRVWQVTQKHDGTSCTVAYAPSVDPEHPEIVCSRNHRIDNDATDSIYWTMAKESGVLDALKAHYFESSNEELAIQGEIVGPGINGNRNKEKCHKLFVFRCWKINDQVFMPPKDLEAFCKRHNIPHVVVVAEDFKFFDEIPTMEQAIAYADGMTPEGNPREGVVLKTSDYLPYASFKIVSNKYLLKEK